MEDCAKLEKLQIDNKQYIFDLPSIKFYLTYVLMHSKLMYCFMYAFFPRCMALYDKAYLQIRNVNVLQ